MKEDAALLSVDTVSHQLRQTDAQVRVVFVGLTSALRTMRTQVLLQHLIKTRLTPGLIHWIRFITDRPQKVCMNHVLSKEIIVSTGACVKGVSD